jgi:hypothetical protein
MEKVMMRVEVEMGQEKEEVQGMPGWCRYTGMEGRHWRVRKGMREAVIGEVGTP